MQRWAKCLARLVQCTLLLGLFSCAGCQNSHSTSLPSLASAQNTSWCVQNTKSCQHLRSMCDYTPPPYDASRTPSGILSFPDKTGDMPFFPGISPRLIKIFSNADSSYNFFYMRKGSCQKETDILRSG